MNDVAVVDLKTGELTNFRPEEVLAEIAKDDAVIELAKRTKDWPLLERAVEKKLDDQEDFVNWWRANVSPNKGGDRQSGEKRGSALFVSEATELTGITQQQVSKWVKRLAKRDDYRGALYGVAYRQAMGALLNNFRAQASGKREWYTPGEYIELSREVMGAIDLDPASSEEAQKTVKAAEYFNAERNGLKQPWHGRVFLNPPYASQDVSLFVTKLVTEFREGRVEQAILLVNNCTDTAWFHEAAQACAVVCFTRGRISFINPDGDSTSPTQGQAFLYFGDDPAGFVDLFGAYGLILARP
jgi:phage N-6-adenine-methyltransferase